MSDERNEAEPIELGYIEDLGDMISVQEGSTVSRTVMQKAGGNVVLFSFDTGEELSEHTAAMPVFVQTLKGRLKVTGNGQFERTLFTSGYSSKTNTYYMNTYDDPAIRSYAMADFDMDSSELITAA